MKSIACKTYLTFILILCRSGFVQTAKKINISLLIILYAVVAGELSWSQSEFLEKGRDGIGISLGFALTQPTTIMWSLNAAVAFKGTANIGLSHYHGRIENIFVNGFGFNIDAFMIKQPKTTPVSLMFSISYLSINDNDFMAFGPSLIRDFQISPACKMLVGITGSIGMMAGQHNTSTNWGILLGIYRNRRNNGFPFLTISILPDKENASVGAMAGFVIPLRNRNSIKH